MCQCSGVISRCIIYMAWISYPDGCFWCCSHTSSQIELGTKNRACPEKIAVRVISVAPRLYRCWKAPRWSPHLYLAIELPHSQNQSQVTLVTCWVNSHQLSSSLTKVQPQVQPALCDAFLSTCLSFHHTAWVIGIPLLDHLNPQYVG